MGSPLMVGCDLRELSEQTKAVLTNRELLAINQDAACRQPYPIRGIWQDSVTAYAKNLSGGDIAIGLFNLGSEKAVSRFNLDELGLPHSTGKTLKLIDIWTGKEAGTANASISWELEPFDCAVFRAKVVDRT